MTDRVRRGHVGFGVVLLVDVVGAALALLVAGRAWQTLHAPRPRPLADTVLDVSGRSLDGASTAVAVVALAAAVALLATRGRARRLVGVVVAACGIVLVWRGIVGLSAIDAARARSLIGSRAGGVGLDGSSLVTVATHPVWPVLSTVAGVLVLLAGVLTVVRAPGWAALSSRYEAPGGADPVPTVEQPQTTEALWSALDRGHDPTDPTDGG